MSSVLPVNAMQSDWAVALDLSHTFLRRLDGEIYFWSSGCQKLFGWSKEEALGCDCRQLLKTNFTEPLDVINTCLSERGSWSGSVVHLSKEGRVLNTASHWVLHRCPGDVQPMVLEVNVEIPGVQSHLAALIDSANDAVIGETLEGIVTSWNPAAARLFEYSAGEMIGRPITVLFPPAMADEESILIDRIRNGEPVSHYETKRVTKSGLVLDISLNLSAIFDHSGKIVGISKIARDITSERAQKREYYLALERQRLAAEAGEVGLWNLNVATRRMEWSDRHKRLFGLDPDATPPPLEDLLEFVHPQDAAAVRSAFDKVLNGAEALDVEYRIVRKDGVVRWISATGKLDDNPDSRSQVVLGTSIDLTERRLCEDALRRANSSFEEFAYAVAHDLQEPLRNISLSLQVMARANTPEIERSAMMGLAVNNADRMQTLVKDLLDFSCALHSSETEIQMIEPGAVLDSVIEGLSHAIEECGARVVVDPFLPSVPIRLSHLVQLFQNLLGNALKYRGPHKPVIRVSGRQERASVVISVEDNGLGIAPEYHQRVFLPFKRLHYNMPGNGIGLSVCKRIVEHYDGKIWLASEQGQGATFFFSVPFTRKPSQHR